MPYDNLLKFILFTYQNRNESELLVPQKTLEGIFPIIDM